MSKIKSIDSRIFSTKEVHGYQPLFLGEDSGLFDSINKPYPAIFDLYMKLKVMDWSHTDFPFRICNEQFKSCSKTDYDKMIKTIAFQWEADSVAAKHIYPIAAPFLSNAELQIAWQRVTENESLHAVTYSEIVRSSFDDPSTVKGEIMAIKESQNRLSHIAKLFEEAYYVSHMLALGQISKNDPKAYRAIFMFVVALYCLERGQFPSSFAVSFAYGMKGMFMPIAHAVQKIQADEFQIHQVLDRTILQIEMATPRGRDFFESAKEEIHHVIHEVLEAELESNRYVFQDGQPAAGFLYKDQVDAFAKANFSPIFETFRFEDPFKDIKNPLPTELLKWFNLNEWQISPQEQRGGNYLRCFVTRDADRIEPLSLGQRQVPSKAFVRPLETLS